MRDVLPELDRWAAEAEEMALATLVRVRGSAPRLPGARLWVTRSGRMAGSVSGGCVESDVFERAMQVLDSRQPALASYGIADDAAFEVGLSCGGTIDVLVEPFVANETWEALRQAVERQCPAVLAIGLSPPALLGCKLVLLGDGTAAGSIDAKLDAPLMAEARRALREASTRIVTFPWQGEEASIFLEAFAPQPRLFIVGATHVAMVLCRMAKELGFRTTIIDARGLFATRERFLDADEIFAAGPEEVLDGVRLNAYSYVVILTHDPKFDIPALARALRSEARYIGVMGNRITHGRRKAVLQEEGFAAGDLDRIRAPIGLDLGARTPEEIALAILAEMVAVRNGTDGRPLCERKGTIHGND
jgi:xanthine dehydrogenase accessory factor